MESFSFSLGSQWEDTSGALFSHIQGASNASYYNQVIASNATDPSADDPLLDGHLIPLAEEERPCIFPGQIPLRPSDDRQRKRCKSEAAHPTSPTGC
jgi:hypothetical protein